MLVSLQWGGRVNCSCLRLLRGPPETWKGTKEDSHIYNAYRTCYKRNNKLCLKGARKLYLVFLIVATVAAYVQQQWNTFSQTVTLENSRLCSTFTLTTWFKIDFKRLTVCIHKHIHSHKHFRAHVLMISFLWAKEKATPLIICCLFKGRKVRGEGTQCVSLHICSCLCECMHVYVCKSTVRVRWSHLH